VKPHPDPATEAALSWAAELSLGLAAIDKPALQEAWNGRAGQQHRDALKRRLPDLLAQLAGAVRARVEALNA